MNCRVRLALLLGGAFTSMANVTLQGAINGPYAPDVNTVHLFHLDEAAGATTSANAAGGNSLIAVDGNPIGAVGGGPLPTASDMLGIPGFFGNAAFVTAADLGLGYDGNNNAQFDPDRVGAAPGDDAISQSSLVGANGAFTFEALLNLPTGQALDQFRQFISTDNSISGLSGRGFQFRLNNVGQMEFDSIGSAPRTNLFGEIPTTGDHAFANDTWFHVAFAYDGEGNATMYWTKVDESVTTPNVIGNFAGLAADLDGTITGPLIIGNENRNVFGTGFRGLLDEVRISNVARGPGDFIFSGAPPVQPGDFDGDGDVDGADFVVWQTNFPKASGGTLDTGDADGDGDVDGADFVIWQTNFPFTPGPGVAPVPEPSAVILTLVGLIGMAGMVHRRR